MFESIAKPLKIEIENVIRTVAWAVVSASMTFAAVIFLSITVYLSVSTNYGRLAASLGLAGFFVAVAAIAVLVLVVPRGRRRAAQRTEREDIEHEQKEERTTPPWTDMGVVATVLPVAAKAAQLVMRHKGTALFAGAALVSVALLKRRPLTHDEKA